MSPAAYTCDPRQRAEGCQGHGAKEYRRRVTCGRTVVRIPLIALDDLIDTKRTGRLEDAADIEVL